MENSDMENGPVEIVDLPIEYGDVPWLSVSLPEGNIHLIWFGWRFNEMLVGNSWFLARNGDLTWLNQEDHVS